MGEGGIAYSRGEKIEKNIWFCGDNNASAIKQFSIAYHKAVKKILNVPYGCSNHDACDVLNILTFNHLVNYNKMRFVYNILKYPTGFIFNNLSFLKRYSVFQYEIEKLLGEKYDVYSSLLSNDIDALLSRIFYVQRRETRSSYISIFNM